MSESILDRRTYLVGTAMAGTTGFAGCLGGSETGTLSTQVTDQPGYIADFESCVVTIVGMWLGPEGAEAGDEEGEEPTDRDYHEYDEPQEADLLDLQEDNTQPVDESELELATYQFLQLDVDSIDAMLERRSRAKIRRLSGLRGTRRSHSTKSSRSVRALTRRSPPTSPRSSVDRPTSTSFSPCRTGSPSSTMATTNNPQRVSHI